MVKLCEICWRVLVRKYRKQRNLSGKWLRVGGGFGSQFVRVMGDEWERGWVHGLQGECDGRNKVGRRRGLNCKGSWDWSGGDWQEKLATQHFTHKVLPLFMMKSCYVIIIIITNIVLLNLSSHSFLSLHFLPVYGITFSWSVSGCEIQTIFCPILFAMKKKQTEEQREGCDVREQNLMPGEGGLWDNERGDVSRKGRKNTEK